MSRERPYAQQDGQERQGCAPAAGPGTQVCYLLRGRAIGPNSTHVLALVCSPRAQALHCPARIPRAPLTSLRTL